MYDYRDAKAMTKTLWNYFAIEKRILKNSESLELVSWMLGYSDWNTFFS